MIVLKGKSASGGVAFGTLRYYSKSENQASRFQVEDIEAEIDRFRRASQKASKELEVLYEKTLHEVGEANAQIFQIHQMMLEDEDYCNSVESIIRTEQINAEFAVSKTCENLSKFFSEMDDAYMQARAIDVRDVSERLILVLTGSFKQAIELEENSILAAEDLTPSETAQLDKSKISAFVTALGSTTSHTAILARTMSIPAVLNVGESLKREYDSLPVVVDGLAGDIYIEPDTDTIETMRKKLAAEIESRELIENLKGKENITLDGHRVKIFANIGSPEDIGSVLKNDAGGIGLFRSEFLYLSSKTYPTEEEQFESYKTVVESMNGKQVIIRTLDIGADKQVEYFNFPKEENPAMGFRAIRICLTRVDLFKTQLRAIYRASAFGKIAIMFPMITSVEEIREIRNIVAEVKDELTREQLEYSNEVELGIMIETPAAAVISDLLAKEVDFFSIGTNDLTQYTLAIDRQNQNEDLDRFFDPYHPAVLRMIKLVVENSHKNGIWAGICGELGADATLTETFLRYGVDELSVSPSEILKLRKRIRETNLND